MNAAAAHVAAWRFHQLDRALWRYWTDGAPAPREVDYGYRHGWIVVDGSSFNRSHAFGPAVTYNGH